MSQADIDAAIAGTYEGDIETSLIGRLDNLNKNQFMMNAKKKQAQGITNFQNKKRDERKEAKLQEKIRLDNLKAAQVAQAAQAAASRAESARQYDPAVHGSNNYGLDSAGKQSYDTGQGFGSSSVDGGPVSNKTGRGRTGYNDGGLASMFTRRR